MRTEIDENLKRIMAAIHRDPNAFRWDVAVEHYYLVARVEFLYEDHGIRTLH